MEAEGTAVMAEVDSAAELLVGVQAAISWVMVGVTSADQQRQ